MLIPARITAVATWVNRAGKVITDHGMAVSVVAKSGAGKGRKDK